MKKIILILLLVLLIGLALVSTAPMRISGAFNFCLFCFPFPLIMIPILFVIVYFILQEKKNKIVLLLCFLTSIAIAIISYYNLQIISPFIAPPVKPDESIENLLPMSIYSFITTALIAFCLCILSVYVFLRQKNPY